MMKKFIKMFVAVAAIAVAATGPARAEGSLTVTASNVYDGNATDKANGVAYFLTTDMATTDSWANLTSLETFQQALEGKQSIALSSGSIRATVSNTDLGLDDGVSVTCYLVIFNSSEVTEGTMYYITNTKNVTTSTGTARALFGNQSSNSQNADNWHEVPQSVPAAPVAPGRYNSAVAITSLQEGDTLAEGASVTGAGYFFTANRYAVKQGTGSYETYTFETDQAITPNGPVGADGVLTISDELSVRPVDENGNYGTLWLVQILITNPPQILLAGVSDPLASSEPVAEEPVAEELWDTLELTHNADGSWGFTMPDYNAALNVSYYLLPDLAWTYNSADMPAGGLTAYRGFELPVIGGIGASMDQDFLTALLNGTVSLRYGSVNGIVNFTNPNDRQSFTINGPGRDTVYMVFDGNDDFLYDSAYFTVNILDPDTLTLAASGNGTVSPLLGGNATQFHAPADWNGQDTEYPTTEDFPGFLATTQEEAMALATGVSDNTAIVIYDQDSDDRWYFIIRNNDSYSPKLTNLAKQTFYACEESGTAIYYTTGGTDIVALVGQEGKYLVIPGTQVQVVAEAQDGNYVQAWSDNRQPGNYTSDTNTITVNETMTLTATFAQNPLLTLAADGQGSEVKLDGVTTIDSALYNIVIYGETQNITAYPHQKVINFWDNVSSVFGGNDTVSITKTGQKQVTITVNRGFSGNITVGAVVVLEDEGGAISDQYITISGTSAGSIHDVEFPEGVTAGTTANTYRVLPGTQVKVIATPDSAHYFVNWDEETALNSNTAVEKTLTMGTAPATLTANFAAKPTVTVVCNGNEKGTMELTEVPQETLLTTINSTSPNNTFRSGSKTFDNIATVTFSGNVENDNNNWGWWSYSGNLTMTVSAAEGYTITRVKFFCKEGGAMDSQAPFQAILKGANGYSANTRMVVGNLSGHNGVTKIEVYGYCNSCPATHLVNVTDSTYRVDYGTEVRATATAKDGYHMDSWSNGAAVTDLLVNNNTITVTTDSTIRANFIANPLLTLASNNGGTVSLDGYTPAGLGTEQLNAPSNWSGDYVSISTGEMPNDFQPVDENVARAWQNTTGKDVYLLFEASAYPSCIYFYANGTQSDNSNTLSKNMAANAVANGKLVLYTTGVIPATYPDGIAATETENTYRVLPGTEVTVTATPDSAHYFVNWDEETALNINTAVEKTLTMGTADAELSATFTAKPVLTLAQNESWGTVSVNGPVVWNNQVWGSWDYFNATFPQTIGDITINKYNFYCYYSYGKLLLDRSVDNNSFVTFTSAGDNFTRIEMTYTAGTNLEPANEWTCANGVAVWEGNAQSVTITNADDFYITQIKFIRGSGVEQLTNNTYRVDYGTEVTVQAAATELHHVSGWQDQNGTELTGATYSDYLVTTPQNLFPAKSALTLTLTADATARALFGINSYDVTAQVAESDDVRGTVAIAYTDIDGAGQTTAAGASAEATAQGGSTSTLTATATDPGYHFVGWMDNLNTQSALNTQNPLTVTETGSYTAVFDTNVYQIGGSVAEGSTEWGSVEGSGEYRHFTTATLTALPIEHYHFVQWEDGNTDNPRIIDVTGEESHEAEFAIDRFTVSWSSNDETMGVIVGPYDNHTTGNPIPRLQGAYGTTFQLTASPAEHHMLDQWSTGQTTNVITVTITENAEIVANFKHVPYSVSVTSADETMGTVSGSQESVEWQASTEISATANYGYHFVRWNDGNTANPRTVTINEEHDYSFTAMFAKNQYTVTVVTGDATRGSVSGTTTVDYLTDVEISATANEHYHFEQWEDGNMQNPRTVTVTANATYRAYFAPDKYTVTGLADQGQGSVTGSGSYAYLSNATLTAEPACGYLFDHWSNESTESTITFQVTGEMSYTAFFRPAVVETVEVHDTTVVTNTVTVHDTTYIDIHDSIDVTVHVHDTTIVEVPVYVHDTTTVTVTEYVHDTTTVTVTEYVHDTTTVTETEYVHDTTVVNVPVHDTVYVSDGTIIYVHDTTTVEVPVNVYVHDTTTIEVQVPVYVHDTTTIEVQVPVYVYDTTTVYDTTVVEVPVHDTTTVTEYEYIHDTVEVTVIVHDTIFIHDTIFVGIEGVDALDAKIYGNNGQIVVEGADFNEVILFDVNGRILARRQDEGLPLRFDIPASGAYLVKIGNHAARRIVMIR